MHRQYHRWYSPSLEREMDLLEFGHGGARVIAFPTSGGTFHEWEDRGMIQALREPLERGWFHLTCVSAVDRESWYARWKHPGGRAWRPAAPVSIVRMPTAIGSGFRIFIVIPFLSSPRSGSTAQ